ncbi:MAG: hypothetical protein CL424_14775 [Acidimicrobiaceae bacterium]|nr:hypothetical protein [Acidimicrobiaceae bacterium]
MTESGAAEGDAERSGVTPEEAPRRSITANLVDLGFSQLLTWTLGIVLTIVQPRFLGAEGQGQLRFAYSVWMIVDVLVSLGTASYLTLEMAKNRQRGLSMVRPILMLRLGGYIAGWGAVVAFTVASGNSGVQAAVVVLIGAGQMFGSVAGTARAALHGMELMRYPAIADVVTKVVSTTAVIAVLLLGGDVVAVSFVAVGAAMLNAWMVVRYLRRFSAAPTFRVPIRVIVAGSVGLFVADASLIVYQQIDTVVMSLLVDKEQLGWYAAADQLFGSLLFVPTILLMTLFPVFSRLREYDPVRLQNIVGRAITTLLVLSVPIGFGVMVLGGPIARILFGPDFDGAGEVLSVLGVVIIITSQTILIGRYAIATGHSRMWNTLMIGAIVLTVPLDLVLVPWTDDRFQSGAIGGALAYVATESLILLAGSWRFASALYTREVVGRSVRIIAAGGVMTAAIWPLRDEFILVPTVIGAAVYVVGIVVLRGLGPDDKDMIGRLFRKVRPAG